MGGGNLVQPLEELVRSQSLFTKRKAVEFLAQPAATDVGRIHGWADLRPRRAPALRALFRIHAHRPPGLRAVCGFARKTRLYDRIGTAVGDDVIHPRAR